MIIRPYKLNYMFLFFVQGSNIFSGDGRRQASPLGAQWVEASRRTWRSVTPNTGAASSRGSQSGSLPVAGC